MAYQFIMSPFALNKTYGLDTLSSFFNVCLPMFMGGKAGPIKA